MPDINTRITDYNQTITQMVEKGLLDIWGRLGEYRDFLVVIGGLVTRYITAPEGISDYDATTHCGTMDIFCSVIQCLLCVVKSVPWGATSKILKKGTI